MNLLKLALIAQDTAPAGGPGGGKFLMIMVVVMGIMIVMTYLPQRRKQKEHKDMMAKLKAGDKVVTIGGIYGEIHQVKDESIVLKVDEKTKMEMAKGSINRLVSNETDSKNKKEEAK